MNTCQVCGAPIADGKKNCNRHAYTRNSSIALAQYIHGLDKAIESSKIAGVASRFAVSTTTVYNHMKREGFKLKREWKKK